MSSSEMRRQARRAQMKFILHVPRQRQAQQCLRVRRVYELYQAQRFDIRADQDVQPVIERNVAVIDPSRASAELAGGFEHGHWHALLRERGRSCHAGVTAADDGD